MRVVDVAHPVEDIDGIAGYASVRVFAVHGAVLVGSVDVPAAGASVPARQVREAIADAMPDRLLAVLLDARCNDAKAAAPHRWPRGCARDSVTRRPGCPTMWTGPSCWRPWTAGRPARGAAVPRRPARDPHRRGPRRGQPAFRSDPGVVEQAGARYVAEPVAGLARARNTGIRAGTGAIVVMTDDDVRCPPEWLETLVAPFADASITAVTGNVLPLELDTPSQQLFEAYGGLGKGFEPRVVDATWFRRRRSAVPTWDIGTTANAAFRRDAFDDDRIGMLDETLGPGTPTGVGEDTYLFYRILEAGGRIAYVPDAWVQHRHRRDMPALRKQLFGTAPAMSPTT